MRIKVYLPAAVFGGDTLDPYMDTSGWVGKPVRVAAQQVGSIVAVDSIDVDGAHLTLELDRPIEGLS